MTNKRTTNPNVVLGTDDNRTCPTCRTETLEFHVSLGEPVHAAAREVNTTGPNAGRVFHVVGVCDGCDTVVEVYADGAEPATGYKPENAVLYDGRPGSGSIIRKGQV